MSIFGTKEVKTRTIQECTKFVEDFFRKIGLNPAAQQLRGQGVLGWFAQRGSAFIYIFLSEFKDLSTIRLVSPILFLPKENLLPFYRRLLEINISLLNCALAIDKDVVVLVNERSLVGLDPEELDQNLNTFAAYADLLDNELANQFGAKIYSERQIAF